jgi:N-terminal acetyltransferase B complex non-catalytic subunit
MHLSLLAEAFHDVLGYKPPSAYKVPASSTPSDHTFVLESLSQISNSFAKFLPGGNADFTTPEFVYFELVSVLSTVILLCADGSRASGNEEVVCQLIDAATATLETVQSHIHYASGDSIEDTVALLTNLHSVGIYREAAEATSLASQWILDFGAREKERDRSGQSNLPKEIMARVKALNTTSAESLKRGETWITGLKTQVKKGDFQARLRSWIYADGDDETQKIRRIVEDDFVADLVAHIKENVEGWQQVKWT